MNRSALHVLATVVACAPSLIAQGVQPMGVVHPSSKPLATVPQYAVPALDRVAIETEDDTRRLQGQPPRYAIPFPVAIDQTTHGSWEVLDPAWSLWRARISAPGASHVNLGFSRFGMPPSGQLMVYSADYQNVLRPFAAADEQPSGELWTPVVNGEDMVIEVYVQTAQRPAVELTLTQVGSGYRFFGAGPHALRDGSGACNVDVVCPVSAPWVLEIPSVAALSSGGFIFCSGFMVNNTAQDLTPYFITAEHCGVTSGNASSLVCYWNYQRAVCGSGSGPLTMFNTGASFRASYVASDFTLVELNAQPNPAWGVTYSGWNRGSGDATSAVAIHHPSGDYKKISFENQPTTTTTYLSTSVPGDGTHIRVADWDLGTTEPGSSGSPLFDQNHRVIGQLHGGYASCSNNSADWYGRLSVSWTGNGSNNSRLSNWLDPLGTQQMTLDTISGGGFATATTYGTGCYTTSATFYEEFTGGFDLTGTASVTNSLEMTSIPNGFAVDSGANAWFQPTSGNLGLGDDSLSPVITLPFTFAYPGGSTNQMRMCSNGYVWLGNQSGADYAPTITKLCTETPRFAPLWMDLNPNLGGSTHYDVDPSNQAVYFTWLGVPRYGAASTGNTMQVVVRSNGTVEYRYRVVDGPASGNAITGWSRGNGVAEPPATDISSALPLEVSVDLVGLGFLPTNRPVMGTTMTLDIDNIPTGTIFGGVLMGFVSHPSGLGLAGMGMPGCYQYTSHDIVFTRVIGGTSTSPFQFPVPTDTFWDGIHLYAQAASLTAGANQLGVLSSNGVDMLFAQF